MMATNASILWGLMTSYLGISILLLLSFIIRRPIRGHAASFSLPKFSWPTRTMSISNIRLVMPSMVVSPRATAPAPHNVTLLVGECKVSLGWMVQVEVLDLSVTSPLASFTLPRLSIDCPLAPFLPFTKTSATCSSESRIRITFHRLRIRVFSSKRVPFFIRVIRAAVMRTMLFGTIARADYARIDLVFGPVVAPSMGPAVEGEEAERGVLGGGEEGAVYESDGLEEGSVEGVEDGQSESDATDGDEDRADDKTSLTSVLPILKPVKKLKEKLRRKSKSSRRLDEHEVHEVDLPRTSDASTSDERSTASTSSENQPISSAQAHEQYPNAQYDHADTNAPQWSASDDDLLVTKTGENLVLHDHSDRLYTFRSLSAGLRRRWSPEIWVVDEDGGESIRGSGVFEMEVEDARWVRASEEKGVRWACEKHDLGEEPNFDVGLPPPSYRQLLTDPMSIVDLRFIHSQVSFDRFRLRDAEFSRYAFETALHLFGLTADPDTDS